MPVLCCFVPFHSNWVDCSKTDSASQITFQFYNIKREFWIIITTNDSIRKIKSFNYCVWRQSTVLRAVHLHLNLLLCVYGKGRIEISMKYLFFISFVSSVVSTFHSFINYLHSFPSIAAFNERLACVVICDKRSLSGLQKIIIKTINSMDILAIYDCLQTIDRQIGINGMIACAARHCAAGFLHSTIFFLYLCVWLAKW